MASAKIIIELHVGLGIKLQALSVSYQQETYNEQHSLKQRTIVSFGAKLSQYVIHSMQNKTVIYTATAFKWKKLK